MAPIWSCVSFLNALPYVEGLRRLPLAERPDLLLDPPFRCAERLRAGEVEAALVPSIELPGLEGARLAGPLGIASEREVRSVILLARAPLSRIRSVAVDANSRTSVALLNLLLSRVHGVRPEMLVLPPDPRAMLERAEAALLIGDAALRASSAGPPALDLASAWHEMTGLPFVFAVWAARGREAAGRAGRLLDAAIGAGIEAVRSRPLPAAAAAAGMTKEDLLDYLTRNIHFTLGAAELRSLELFHAMCREEGLLGRGGEPGS